MAADGTLRFDTRIDSDGFNKGTASITQNLGKLKNSLLKIGSIVGISFGISSLISFGKAAIETASDVQEVQNVVDTAFSEMKYQMEEFADTAIETYGISKLAAKQTGSTLMAMASGMGIADEAASDMALTLTGLSADMASFYNKEQEETFTALKGVFTGETEALKSYGIVMTETNLQEYAYTQGINKKISAMSQAEKVQLRYNFILEKTALAQGDFARTSDGWANQTRILSMQWKEFSGVIGTALINIALPAVRTLNNAMSQLIAFANNAVSKLAAIFGWNIETNNSATVAADTSDAIATAVDNQEDLTEATEATAKANEKTLAGFDKINKLNESSSSSSGSDAGSSISMGSSGTTVNTVSVGVDVDTSQAESKLDYFKQWYDSNFKGLLSRLWDDFTAEAEELKGTLEGVFADITTLAEPFKEYFNSDFTACLQTAFLTLGGIINGLFDTFNMAFGDIWDIVLFPFAQSLVNYLLPTVTQIYTQMILTLGTLFTEIKTLFDEVWTNGIAPALAVIQGIITDLFASISAAWQKWGEPIFNNLREAISGTCSVIMNLWNNVLKPVWDKLVKAVKEIWDDHLKPLVDNFLDFVGEFVNGALEIYNKFIVPIVNWLVTKFGPPISEIFQKIVNWVKNAIAKVVDIVNGIITALKGVVQFIVGVFTGDWEKAWEGIKNFFSGIWDSLVEIVSTPIELIQTLISDLKDWIGNRWNDIKSFFLEIPDWFKDKFSAAWTKIKEVFGLDTIKSYFNSILESIKNAFTSIPDWFKDKFSTAWQKVKDVFSKGGEVFNGIKDGILNALKSVINGLIEGINNVIATPFNGINTALKKIRDISIAGVKPFESKISLITVPQIPKLATGTVVPANYGEFLAVLGDNKRETEVVSPLSTIKQALAEVLAAKGDGGDINIVIELDGDVVYKNVVKKNKQNTKRTGVNALAY